MSPQGNPAGSIVLNDSFQLLGTFHMEKQAKISQKKQLLWKKVPQASKICALNLKSRDWLPNCK